MALQHGVPGHRHHVVEPWLGIQEVEDLRRRKAPVEPHEKPRLGKGLPQQGQQPAQHAHTPAGGRHIAGPQHRRAQIVEGQKQQRQVAPAIVVPVEEGELLGAVRRVVGRIQVDRDPPRPPVQPALMPLDDPHRQLASQLVEGGPADAVLEPRDRRLRGQRLPRHRVPPEQQLVDRVVGEVVGVVAGNAEDRWLLLFS